MGKPATLDMTIEATDVSQQKMVSVSDIPDDATVSELIQSLLPRMHLPGNDVAGRPLTYQALNEHAGRHLRGDEKVGEALRSGERIVLQPNIDAGGVN